MIGTPEQDAFISKNKWAVVTTLRSDGSPTSSVVFFAREGDTLIFSTTLDRVKAKTVQRDARMAFCVIDEGSPFGYVTVEGPASIDPGENVPGHILVNEAMRGTAFTPSADYAEKLKESKRVIIRLMPDRVHGVVNRGG
jgi:PPOX class probable F420-dependent enzyme